MRYFEIYIFDSRYSVPTLRFVDVDDEGHAREIAEQILSESDHHLGVEVAEEGRTLLVVGQGGGKVMARRLRSAERPGEEG